MAVHLDLPSEIAESADRLGVSVSEYVLATLLNSQADEQAQLSRKQAGENIRELRKGNNLGPDLTIRDLIEDGRRL